MKKCFILLWGSILYATYIFAEENPKTQEIKVIADSLECDQIAGKCTAKGNAFVEKMNDPQNKKLTADEIDVFFEKDESDKKSTQQGIEAEKSHQKPKEFHAYGNVVVIIKESIIRGDRATYYPETEIVEIFENVSVTSGKNQIIGNYGRADLATGTYKILNSKERVQALIYKSDNQKKTVKK